MMKKIKDHLVSVIAILLIAGVVLINILWAGDFISSIFSPKAPSKEEIAMWYDDGYQQGYEDGYEDGFSAGSRDKD